MSADTEEAVRVLYDYKFLDDTGEIEIKAGDVYRLINKTNDEWWQVCNFTDDDDDDFFFVPAQYVAIITLTDADKSDLYDEDSLESFQSCSDNSEEAVEYARNIRDNASATVLSNSTGEYVNLDQYRGAAGIKNENSEHNAEATKTDPSSTKLNSRAKVPWHLLQTTTPPPPENEKFVRVLAKDLPWDIYRDDDSGRLYYVNRETGERLWKPPRKNNADQASLPAAFSSNLVIKGQPDVTVENNQVKENGSDFIPQKFTQKKERNQGLAKVINTHRSTLLAAPNSTGSLHSQFENDLEGYFYKTKVLDANKKKVKKSWAQIYVVLQGSNLVFYKDQKSASQRQGSSSSKPEAVASLQGAHIDLNPKELTSKKNAIALKVSAGNIYLFHSENEKDNLEWFTRMKIVANDMSLADTKDTITQEVKKNERGDSVERTKKGMIRSSSADESSSGSAPNFHNFERTRNTIRIRAKLYNLISRRPTKEDLYNSGIMKDAVFGSRLHELCDRERVNVPNFVHQCIAAIESKGITHDGLYRISGNMAEIQRLRCTVDSSDTYNLYDEQWDINVLSGALKLFFRELKEPIFTLRLHERFINAIKIESHKEKLSAFKSAVSDLPRCNHATLKELFQHLLRVIDASHRNRMQSQNIAIVFGPTLLWQHDSLQIQATQAVYQNRIVEYILQEYKYFFN